MYIVAVDMRPMKSPCPNITRRGDPDAGAMFSESTKSVTCGQVGKVSSLEAVGPGTPQHTMSYGKH